MNGLNISSWSINVKMFFILLGAFLTLNLINTPLTIQTFNEVNRQVFRQVVTETALRQKEAIEEDFLVALGFFEQLPEQTIPYLSITQWLTRSDPSTENFDVEAGQAKASADRAIAAEVLELAPTLFRQAWLLDADGQVITNITNFIDPRFEVNVGEYIDQSESPAHRAGELLGETATSKRNFDVVVEQIDDRLSLQFVSAILLNDGQFVGTLVVELNNVSLILSNLQLSSENNETYSFVASPSASTEVAIALGMTNPNQINLDTQATRTSNELQDAVFYQSGNRSVIGFYTPLFDDLRNDLLLIVELDEAIALRDVSASVIGASGPNILLSIALLIIGILIINRLFVRPITVVTDTLRAITAGDLRSPLPINTNDDEIGRLAETVVELRHQLNTITTDMSIRESARIRDLQVTQEIGRVATSENDVEKLMIEVVNLIVERFDAIYHAQIFLVEGNYAVLKSSTGKAGEQLLARGHRLGVGSLSVIGQVTQQNQTIIARDTASSEVHRRNEFLQDTRAELAIPMRLGTRVIGVLDVQSALRDAFDDDMVTILETMTSQIAIAIENSRLFEASNRRLQELDNAARQRIQRNWEDFMYTQRTEQLTMRAGAKATHDFTDLRQQATQTQRIITGMITDRNTVPIAIPIVIREQVLGVIEWEISEAEFNQNRLLLAEELATRLAVSLDNARLVQTGQQTAENERIINTISAKISGQTDIEQILQTAIQEVGQALRAPQVNINLQQPNVKRNDHRNGNGHQPTSDNT